MARLPTPGRDSGNWGVILNDYLSQSHKPDGSLRADIGNIADLKAVDVSQIRDKMQALVAGYYAHGDGGGGHFYYDVDARDVDNGGTIIAPDAGVGRWKRLHSGPVSVKWFGARCDCGSRTASTSALSPTMAIPTSGLSVGQIVFVPGAGIAGRVLRATITAVGRGNVTLSAAASHTLHNVTIYYGTPDHGPINAAIIFASDAAGEIYLPRGMALIEEPLNITMQSNGITLRGSARYRSSILANTGAVAVDLCGTSACRMENMRICTVAQLDNPSTVAIALMRARSRSIAAYCEFRRLYVDLASNPLANQGAGSIAFYNYGGEFNVHDTVVYKADLPVVIANTNLYSVSSYWTDALQRGTAMTQTEFIGVNELSARGGGNCMVISNAANVNVNSYFAKVTDESTEAAIKIVGTLKTGEFNINVEHYGKILDVQGETSRLRICGNVDYLITGTPWYDIKAECRHCVFGMFPGGTADDGTGEPLFALSGSGKLTACDAHVMKGRDTGLTESTGRDVRLISELCSPVQARMKTGAVFPAIPHDSRQRVVFGEKKWDALSLYSLKGEFSAPVSGFYDISARYQINLAAPASAAELCISVAGLSRVRTQTALGSGVQTISVSGVVYAMRSQTISVWVYQDSGQATRAVGEFAADATDLSIRLL